MIVKDAVIVKEDINVRWNRLHGCDFSSTELGMKLHPLPLDGAWVAGGALRRAIEGEPQGNDIDIFFRDADAFEKFDAYCARNFRSNRHNDTQRRASYDYNGIDLDLVHGTFFPSPEAMLWDFDFRCCCWATDKQSIWYHSDAPVDTAERIIRINNRARLSKSLGHMERMMRQGWAAEPAALDELLKYGKAEREMMCPEYSGKRRAE